MLCMKSQIQNFGMLFSPQTVNVQYPSHAKCDFSVHLVHSMLKVLLCILHFLLSNRKAVYQKVCNILNLPLSALQVSKNNGQMPESKDPFISAAAQLFLSLTLRHSRHNLSPFVICCLGASYLACQQNDELSPAMGVTSTASSHISQ